MRRRFTVKYLADSDAARGAIIGGSPHRRGTRSRVGLSRCSFARVGPIAAIALTDKSKEAAITYRGGAHHAEHVDRAAGGASRRLGTRRICFEHASAIHHPAKIRSGPHRCKVFDS